MCGICGFNWKDEKLVREMSESLKHRGPDAEGIYADNKISLGHRRLSIIDLSDNARQPMSDSENSLVIVYNGEIYNFMDLRKDLESKGYSFKSKSDTEVIIYAYKEYGIECLKEFNGMFAFCIYDKKKHLLFLARDRIGVKPLYYYIKDGKFLFASEIKALLKSNIDVKLNERALADYFAFQNILDNKTLFKDIRLLMPGEFMLYDINKKILSVKKYWDVVFKYNDGSKERVGSEDIDYYINKFKTLLNDSVQRHMISDVPLGSYLSGGFDSSSVTATAAILEKEKNKKIRLNTFTAKYKESQYNETECSSALAKKYNAIKNDVVIRPEDFLMGINKLVYHLDEPKVGLPAISGYYVAKRASKDVTVVLTGHAGDELFLGYPVYKAFYLKSLIRKNPLNIFKGLSMFRFSEMPRAAYYLFFPFFDPETKHGIFIMFNKRQRKKLFHREFYEKIKDYEPASTVIRYYIKNQDHLMNLQRIYIKAYLPSMLIVEDKISMAHSIEGRIPFCDYKLVEFSLETPVEIKLHNKELKYIVKESMKDRLPGIFYNQEKRGFPTPLSLWFRKELKRYAYDLLLSERTISRKIFNERYVKKLLDKHSQSKTDGLMDLVNAARIWSLINIEVWLRIFVDKDKKILKEVLNQ